jgi:hypothetical protein
MTRKFYFASFGLALLGILLFVAGNAEAQVCGDCKTTSSAGVCMGKAVNSPCGRDKFCVNLHAQNCPLGIDACGCSGLDGASTQQPRQIQAPSSGTPSTNPTGVTPVNRPSTLGGY